MPEASAAQAPRGEVAALVAVQAALGDRPGVLSVARALSHFGEHSVGWVAVALLGAVLSPKRRGDWLIAGAAPSSPTPPPWSSSGSCGASGRTIPPSW